VTKENPKEAFIMVQKTKDDDDNTSSSSTKKRMMTYFIDQKQYDYFNRSFHHDMVIIEPLPSHLWGRPIGRRRIVNPNDMDEINNTSSIPAVPSARVITIQQASRRILVATMVDIPTNNDDSMILVIPMDLRYPKVRIKTRGWKHYINCRLKIQIDGWDIQSYYPYGHCLEILGPIGHLETEIKSLLIENQVNLIPFSPQALATLPLEGKEWTIHSDQNNDNRNPIFQNRRDLRTTRRIFSVDPPGCQDIDDSMHAEILPNGDIEGNNRK
jgi:DIS3-like exonuclease 1